ncbi:RND transporter [Alienimonas californiensis]|uniref:RND transporter n=1 Tax=Alienimonas californiensis TaxID=2527989 RepID=A0A517PB20_9PLAN|nr:RND transporter [Alienimonas californiensis]QDT16568.1 hypothetical protein CA12_26740 [Alienimonas californiensis]
MLFRFHVPLAAVLSVGATLALTGCGADDSPDAPAAVPMADADHDHDADVGWWCVEHGVPEGECALCDASLVADFKEKGDWCAEHDRPESQCFLCDPDRFDRFAARYAAKYGEQPPRPTE